MPNGLVMRSLSVSCIALGAWLQIVPVGAQQGVPPQSPPERAPPARATSDTAPSDRQQNNRELRRATEPMKITRVRAASNCATDCPEWISAEGRIVTNVTAAQLKRVLAGLGDSKLPIFIHSAGGSVEEAYAMGRMIRAKGLVVSVTKTDLADCATGDKDCRSLAAKGIRTGTPKPALSVCASSCAFVLAGGVLRHVGPLSFVGVHQYETRVTHVQILQKYRMVPRAGTGEMVKEVISEERVAQKTVKARTTSDVYDKSQTYFGDMGVTADIMKPLRATPHDSMHWLSPAEIVATKLATDRQTGQKVLDQTRKASADGATRAPPAGGAATAGGARVAAVPAELSQSASGCGPRGCSTAADARLVRSIQEYLKGANCLSGDPAATWGERPTRAAAAFAAAANVKLDAATPSEAMLVAVRSAAKQTVCAAPAG